MQKDRFIASAMTLGLMSAVATWVLTLMGIFWGYQFDVITANGTLPIRFHYVTLGWAMCVVAFSVTLRTSRVTLTMVITAAMLVVAPALVAALAA